MASPNSDKISGKSLAGIALLEHVPARMIADLETRCQWLEFKQDDDVIDLKDTTTDVYFVIRGKLRVMNYVKEDQQIALAEIETGETFGELSAIDLMVRSARVTALEPCLLASISGEDFRKLLHECPEASMDLLKRLTGLIRTLSTRVITMGSMSLHQRVYYELLRLSEPSTAEDGSWIIANAPNHSEIASWVGGEKQTVADAIGSLAREGVIERKHKNLIIWDHARLQRLVNQQ